MYHDFITIDCQDCKASFVVPVYCGDRFCPTCGVVRLAKVRKRLKWLLAACKPPKNHRLKMVTLSIPNESSLRDQVKSLVASFRKLRNRAYWKKRVSGGAFVIEIKGHEGNWHAHIHCIVYASWLDWTRLLHIWKSVSTGSAVYVSDIPISKAVHYLTKYLTKDELPCHDFEEASWALKGQRLFSPIGNWYKLNSSFPVEKSVCPCCNSPDLIVLGFPECLSLEDGYLRSAKYKYRSPPEDQPGNREVVYMSDTSPLQPQRPSQCSIIECL